jgi:hypothetical protein
MHGHIGKGILAILGALVLFVVSEIIGGLITAYLIRRYGVVCPFAAKKERVTNARVVLGDRVVC